MKATPIPIESICCIGAGYVGWPTMAVIADRCPEAQVTVVDLNAERTAAWNDPDLAQLPVYEPDLNAVVCRVRGPSLQFSTAVEEAIASVDMVFISVNTPTKTRGLGAGQTSDLKWVEASPRTMAWAVCEHTIVVEKSTQPVRTFAVLSNPEFMAKGTAIAYQETPNWELISGKEPEAYRYLPGLPASGNLPTGPSLQAFRGDREQRHDKGIIDLTNHLKENRLRQSAINGPRHHCKSRSEMHTNQIDTNPDPNPSTSAQSINTLLSQSAPTSKQGDECND